MDDMFSEGLRFDEENFFACFLEMEGGAHEQVGLAGAFRAKDVDGVEGGVFREEFVGDEVIFGREEIF